MNLLSKTAIFRESTFMQNHKASVLIKNLSKQAHITCNMKHKFKIIIYQIPFIRVIKVIVFLTSISSNTLCAIPIFLNFELLFKRLLPAYKSHLHAELIRESWITLSQHIILSPCSHVETAQCSEYWLCRIWGFVCAYEKWSGIHY
jgi:hypothetical protein